MSPALGTGSGGAGGSGPNVIGRSGGPGGTSAGNNNVPGVPPVGSVQLPLGAGYGAGIPSPLNNYGGPTSNTPGGPGYVLVTW